MREAALSHTSFFKLAADFYYGRQLNKPTSPLVRLNCLAEIKYNKLTRPAIRLIAEEMSNWLLLA